MFKLFGKKKDQQPDPQTQPAQEDPQVLQSQHPLASALAAQFGQEEFDILAVTGANSFGGEQCPGEEYRTVTLPITAWREDDGPVHQEDTCLVALADDPLLALDNLTMTPHTAGNVVDALPKSPLLLAKVIQDYWAAGRSDMVVNQSALKA